jgi:hypothetical protein
MGIVKFFFFTGGTPAETRSGQFQSCNLSTCFPEVGPPSRFVSVGKSCCIYLAKKDANHLECNQIQ